MAKALETTLADELLHASKTRATIMEPKLMSKLDHVLRSAQRFVLTEEAAIKVGEAIHNYPEMLVEQGIFARAPFDTCWIELPSYEFHERIVPGSASPSSDIRTGYLFHEGRVYVGAQNTSNLGADWSPMCYHLHQPLSLEQEIKMAEDLKLSRMQLDNFYWGGTMATNLSPDIVRGLRMQHGFSVHIQDRFKHKIRGDEWLGFSAGEVRNLMGLLLMLNQPSKIIRTEAVAHRRKMTPKGVRVLQSHSIITINLDGRSKLSRLFRKPVGASHASPKWHNVMDHWCNDYISRTTGYSMDDPKTIGQRHAVGMHAHDWEQTSIEKLQFQCTICGGRRWRRKMVNGRGDKSRGIVTQERIVKTNANPNIRNKFIRGNLND